MKARRLEVFAGLIPGDSVAASGSPVTHRLGFSWENWANVPGSGLIVLLGFSWENWPQPIGGFCDSAIMANRPKS
jgi:hypothetical protein